MKLQTLSNTKNKTNKEMKQYNKIHLRILAIVLSFVIANLLNVNQVSAKTIGDLT